MTRPYGEVVKIMNMLSTLNPQGFTGGKDVGTNGPVQDGFVGDGTFDSTLTGGAGSAVHGRRPLIPRRLGARPRLRRPPRPPAIGDRPAKTLPPRRTRRPRQCGLGLAAAVAEEPEGLAAVRRVAFDGARRRPLSRIFR